MGLQNYGVCRYGLAGRGREKAYGEYEKFKVIQDRTFVSDFDKFNEESVSGPDAPLLPFDINPDED